MKKIREKLKRFRLDEKGFTLVELIVVIAIIGILTAIGTIAYTGYIENANESSDEQILYDLSYAIQLGAADEGLTDHVRANSWGVLEYDPDAQGTESDSYWKYVDITEGFTIYETSYSDSDDGSYADPLDEPVSSYADTLTIDILAQDDEYRENLVTTWLEDGVGSDWYSQNMKSDLYSEASIIYIYIPSGDLYTDVDSDVSDTIATKLGSYASSSYYTHEEELLEAVDGIASAFGTIVTGSTGYTLQKLLGLDDDEYAEFLETYGVTDEEDADQMGAAMVLYMASQLSENYTEDVISELADEVATTEFDTSEFMSTITSGGYDTEFFAELTAQLGAATAYANSGEASDEYLSTYDDMLEYLTSDTSSGYTSALYLGNLIYAMYEEIDTDSDYYTSGKLASDTSAYVSLLSVLDEEYSSGNLTSTDWDEDVLEYLNTLLENYGYSTSDSE